MMKKAFALAIFLTVLCMGLALLPISAEGETVGAPDGIGAPALPVHTVPTDNWLDYAETVSEKDGVYEIGSAEQLAWVAKQLAMMKTDFSGKTIKLTADIDLSAHLWTPIGHKDMAFAGDFDGQSYTIKGLIITDAANAGDYVGLFGKASGKIKHTAIAEAYINITLSSNLFVGALVGTASSSIEDCRVSDTEVRGSGDSYSSAYIGGIVGSASDIANGSVSRTVVSGSARNVYSGGVAGRSNASIANCSVISTTVSGSSYYCYSGGVAGYAYSVADCSVSDTAVSGWGSGSSARIGGIAGEAYSFIKNCAVSDTEVSGRGSGGSSVNIGGIAGYTASTFYIADCTVSGATVSGSSNYGAYTGGVAGCAYTSVNGCHVRDTAVIGSSSYSGDYLSYHAYTGGIAGMAYSSVNGCSVSNASVSGSSGSGSSCAYTGGLVGSAFSESSSRSIEDNTVSDTAVTGSSSGSAASAYTGGLAGSVSSPASVVNCGVVGVGLTVKGTSASSYAGGLCGAAGSSLSNSFAVFSLTSENENLKVGGMVGSNAASITGCYAHVDTDSLWYGIAYANSGTVLNTSYNNTASGDFNTNSGRAFDCKVLTDAEMKADAFVATLNGYVEESTDALTFWAKDTQAVNGGFPILVSPKVTSFEAIAPTYRGGSIRFEFHGEHLDKHKKLNADWMSELTVVSESLITASHAPSESSWQTTSDGYTYSGTAGFYMDGVLFSFPYTVTIPSEQPKPKVTALSYEDTVFSAGGQVEVVLSGENLADCTEKITLTAVSLAGTVSTTEVSRDGDSLRMTLDIPKNETASDVVYTLSVTVGSVSQSLPSYTLTVNAQHPLDVNKDGIVDVMDAMFIIRYIFENA